jgi:hypothetical protein
MHKNGTLHTSINPVNLSRTHIYISITQHTKVFFFSNSEAEWVGLQGKRAEVEVRSEGGKKGVNEPRL